MDDEQMAAATLTWMLHAIDALDWGGVRRSLADGIATDHSELSGGPPRRCPAAPLSSGGRGRCRAHEG